MPDENLLRFIKENRAQDRSDDVISTLLLQNGWAQNKIDEAFTYLKNPQPIQDTSPSKSLPSKPSDLSSEPQTSATPKNSSAFNFFSYRGRIGRLKYVLGLIAVAAIATVIGLVVIFCEIFFITGISRSASSAFNILVGFGLPVVLIGIVPYVLASSVIVKRFHDLGKSGVWFFALLIPFYNIYLVFGLVLERGTLGPNQYGDDPLPPDANPNDIFHNLSQNKGLRITLVVILFFFALIFGVIGKFKNNTAQQNAINQAVQSIACDNSTSSPIAISTPDPTWASYSFPNANRYNFGGFSFQYPTQYAGIEAIHLATSSQYDVGVIGDSTNPNFAGTISVLVNFSASNGSSSDQILSLGEYPASIAGMQNFETASGIQGEEMIFKNQSPGTCLGYVTRAKILFDLPQVQPESQPMVIVFDAGTWAENNYFVESIAKTFTLQKAAVNSPSTPSGSTNSNSGTNTPSCSGTLCVSLDKANSEQSTSIVPNSTGNVFLIADLTAGPSANVTITKTGFSCGGACLFTDTDLIMAANGQTWTNSNQNVYEFDNTNLVIPRGKTVVIKLIGNVSPSAPSGQQVSWSLFGFDVTTANGSSATGQAQGTLLTIDGGNNR